MAVPAMQLVQWVADCLAVAPARPREQNEGRQQPMKKAGGGIPRANFRGGSPLARVVTHDWVSSARPYATRSGGGRALPAGASPERGWHVDCDAHCFSRLKLSCRLGAKPSSDLWQLPQPRVIAG